MFIVRRMSETSGTALCCRSKFISSSEICHYIVVKHQRRQSFVIRGFNKEFSDLKPLVTHCSFIRDMLPVLLDLSFYRKEIILHESKMNDLYNFSSRSSIKSSIPSASSIDRLSSQGSVDQNTLFFICFVLINLLFIAFWIFNELSINLKNCLQRYHSIWQILTFIYFNIVPWSNKQLDPLFLPKLEFKKLAQIKC